MFHRYFYKFWKTQPVAWTSIIPKPVGIITTQIPPALSIPIAYTMEYRSQAYDKIASFLNDHYLETVSTTYTSSSLNQTYQGQCNLIYDNKKQILGCIFYTKFIFTYHHQLYPCYWIDKLCIHKQYRKQRLVPILLSNTIEQQQKTQTEPIIAMFHRSQRLPFPEFYDSVYYATVINKIMFMDEEHQQFIQDHKSLLKRGSVKDLIQYEQLYKLQEQTDAMIRIPIQNPQTSQNRQNQELWTSIEKDPNHWIMMYQKEGIHFLHLQKLPLVKETWMIVNHIGNKQCVYEALIIFISNSIPLDEIALVCPHDLTNAFHETTAWTVFDRQSYYFYNFRLNAKTATRPLILPFGTL